MAVTAGFLLGIIWFPIGWYMRGVMRRSARRTYKRL